MRVECEICGAYTEDPKQIEWAKKYRTCPECRHIGSLFIAEEDESMKEDMYMVDLTIHKEVYVKAGTPGEAKEKAIEAAQFMGQYYALEIEDVKKVEEWE
jgi:ribosome-binding protein aMBF1 (putative translation factor)